MRTRPAIIVLIAIALVTGAFILGMMAYFVSAPDKKVGLFFGNEVGLVTIEGGIFESKDTVDELDKYRKDGDIKAVVIRVESPGGTVAASQEIYGAIKRLALEKPAVVSMGSIAASGGYYIACGATKIVANPATITGSIGVRMDHVQFGELLKWARIGHETLKSGKFKDIASPDRPITPEERQLLEKMLSEMHLQFKEIVLKERKIPMDMIDKIADGRIFTGDEALSLGLIDQLGGLFEAVQLAGKLANIKGEPKVVEKHKSHKGWFSRIFEEALSELKFISIENKRSFREPMMLYWTY
jgi:protease-4